MRDREERGEAAAEEADGETSEGETQSVELSLGTYFLLSFVNFSLPVFPVIALGWATFRFLGPLLLGVGTWLLVLVLPPLVLAFYLVYLLLVALVVKLEIDHWSAVSPPQQDEYRRTFTKEGPADPRIHYYHLRGFVIKYPVWLFAKSPFPWMVNWLLRTASHNKIGRNVVQENVMVGLEFTDVRDGVVIGPGGSLSSHVVDSIFGKLSIFEILVDRNAVLAPNAIMGPGAKLAPGQVLMPNSVGIKFWHGKEGFDFYNGSPGRPMTEYRGIVELERSLGIADSGPGEAQ